MKPAEILKREGKAPRPDTLAKKAGAIEMSAPAKMPETKEEKRLAAVDDAIRRAHIARASK